MAKELTPRQIRFVQLYVQSGNATKAAQQAGYHGDENSLASMASRLLRNVKIAALVTDAQKDVVALFAAENYRNFLRELDMAQNAESEAVRLAAIKDMLDRGGTKPADKTEHSGKVGMEHGGNTDFLDRFAATHPELVDALFGKRAKTGDGSSES